MPDTPRGSAAACTCRRDPLDGMPLVDAACPIHGRGPITEDEKARATATPTRIATLRHHRQMADDLFRGPDD